MSYWEPHIRILPIFNPTAEYDVTYLKTAHKLKLLNKSPCKTTQNPSLFQHSLHLTSILIITVQNLQNAQVQIPILLLIKDYNITYICISPQMSFNIKWSYYIRTQHSLSNIYTYLHRHYSHLFFYNLNYYNHTLFIK